jgi:trans-aconitate methyltransferase
VTRTPDAYFERMYATDPDPWGYETRWYERRKYALTVAALPREHYRRAFEPGCSIGVLTEMLAPRCEAVVALELVPHVAARARVRAAENVAVDVGRIPEDWPAGTFDLVVLSEVLYYLDEAGIADVLAKLDACLAPAGHVIAVHWRGETDYPVTGDRVHELLDRHPVLHRLACHVEDGFLLATYEGTT